VGDNASKLATWDDHVDLAMVELEFRALEPRR
jgi:hypothetical protein